MSESRATDPFLSFRFTISLDGSTVGGFSDVSGLELTNTVHDYAEGGLNGFVRKFPGPITQTNIVLKRGIVDRTLWTWFADLMAGNVQTRNGSISVLDPTGEHQQMRIDFTDGLPAKWTGPTLDASQGKVAVETLEIAHQGLNWLNAG